MAIRILVAGCFFLLAACGGSSSSNGGGVNPNTNVSLDEGNVSVLDEGRTYELLPGGGSGAGADVVEWRWSDNPINAGALPACSSVNGFNPQLAALRLDAACANATNCTIDFDQKQSSNGETAFDLSIPVLKAPIGLTYQLTAVNSAQQTTVGNFTFCLIAINEAPDAVDDVFIATEGTALTVSSTTGLNLLSNDTDDNDLGNKPLTVNTTPITPPTLATEFTLQNDGGFSYLYVGASDVPAGQTLTDSFGYQISDGFNTSTATVTINIGTSDKPPLAIAAIPDQSIVAGVEKPFDLSTFFVDPENGELIFAAVSDTLPSAGSLSISNLGVLGGAAGVGDVGEHTVRFTVSDQVSASAATNAPLEASLKLVVTANQAPTVTAIQDEMFEFGELISLDLSQYFSDAEAQPLKYSVKTEPSSTLQINESSGLLTGQLSVAGKFEISVSANDGINSSVTQTFTVEQLPSPNAPPVLTTPQPDVEITIGVPMDTITAAFTDPENKPLVYAINTLPAGLSFDAATGELTGTPTELGNYNLRFTATDDEDASTLSNSFLLQVISLPNRPPAPAVVIDDEVIILGEAMKPANAGFDDPDGDQITYSISPTLPAGYAFNFGTGTLTGTPAAAGATAFTISASDGAETVTSNAFTITVNTPANTAPVQGSSIADQSVTLGDPIAAVNGGFTDADGDTLSYSIAPAVTGSGLSFSPTTGILSGVPGAVGSVDYTITAADGTAATASNEFTIAVTAPLNSAPVAGAAIQNQTVVEGAMIAPVDGGFTDPDGDTLTYTITPSVVGSGLVFSTSTGILSGTPVASGDLSFRIRASDGTAATLTNLFTINVDEAASAAPVQGKEIADQIVDVGETITPINGNFTDTDSTTLAYTLSASPGGNGLALNGTTGTLSGAVNTAGVLTYTITASDGTNSTESNEFTITVNELIAPNNPPVAGPAIPDQSVTVGESIADVNGGFTDPDGDSLSYTIAPAASTAGAGLLFDEATGDLSGAPSVVGTHDFVISASDGDLETDSAEFSIVVTPVVIVPPPPPPSS